MIGFVNQPVNQICKHFEACLSRFTVVFDFLITENISGDIADGTVEFSPP